MILIDLNAIKEWIENWLVMNKHYHPYSKNNSIPISELYDVLERLPTVELVNHGHWEEKKVEYDDKAEMIQEWQSAKCSVCGRYDTRPHLYYPKWSNYCPNCGAKMEVEE